VYRFISTGTIEEKIFQRQASKQALSSAVVDEKEDTERHFSVDALRQLFLFKENTLCETHDTFKCKRCKDGKQVTKAPALLYGDASTYVLSVRFLPHILTSRRRLLIAGTISRMQSLRIIMTICCVQRPANRKSLLFSNTSVTRYHSLPTLTVLRAKVACHGNTKVPGESDSTVLQRYLAMTLR
jgi:hypothetical protein